MCKHPFSAGGTRRGRRANQRPAVVPSSRRGEQPAVCRWQPGRAPGQQARVKTVNIQRWGGSSPWTRPPASGCGDKGGDQGNLAPGSLSTVSPASRTPLLLKGGDGSMYSQAYVRSWAVSRA